MKRYKTIFWVSSTLLFLTQGLMPLLTMHSDASKAAMTQLGYPAYFGVMLAVFKFFGGLAIVLPKVPGRVKEWAFAGFAIDFICAFISLWATGADLPVLLFPLMALLILILCYYAFYQISREKEQAV